MNFWLVHHKLPLGPWLSQGVDFLTLHGQAFFDVIVSLVLSAVIGGITAVLLFPPAPRADRLPCSCRRAYALASFHRPVPCSLRWGCCSIVNLGYWQASIETLALVFSATLFCVA